MILELVGWIWDHWQEVTFNTLLLFILRKFILKELTKLFSFNRNIASLNNQRVIMRELGVEKEWDAGRPNLNRITVTKSLNGLRIITSHAHFTTLFTRRMAIKKLHWRKTKMKSKLLSRKFLMAILAAVLPIVNQEFNLGLNTDTIIAVIGGISVYILGQAHVDKAIVQNGGNPVADTKPTVEPGANK